MDPAPSAAVGSTTQADNYWTKRAFAAEAERDRLAYTNEKLKDALVFVVRGHSAHDALLAAGLDPFPILTGAPR